MYTKAFTATTALVLIAVLSACSGPADDGSKATADVAAAESALKPYVDAPSAFPVTTPLKSLPTGATIAVLDCGTPICGLFADLASAPAEALGMKVVRIDSGTTVDGVAASFNTVLEGNFDGVFVPALAPSLWERELDELNNEGIPVVTAGVIGLDPAKVVAASSGDKWSVASGKVMADWVVAKDGDSTNVVFYTTPELSFSATVEEAFSDELNRLCTNCAARVVEIPVAQFGTGAAQIVVDDLLGHPGTTTSVFAVGEQSIGLPSALKAADLSIDTLLNAPDPSVLAGIKDGSYTAGVGLDLAVETWTLIDALARAITGQDVDQAVKDDEQVIQVLTAEKLPDDVSHGWTGYPDFATRFVALWKEAQ